jgi:hypothetical protein
MGWARRLLHFVSISTALGITGFFAYDYLSLVERDVSFRTAYLLVALLVAANLISATHPGKER